MLLLDSVSKINNSSISATTSVDYRFSHILECPSLHHLTSQGDGGTGSLPPLVYSVRTTSNSFSQPPEELFAFTYPSSFYTWCSGTSVPLPHNITVNMTEPVVLYELLSGGYRPSTSLTTPPMTEDYATSFSLDYMETDDSDVMPYQRQMVSYTECQTYI